MESNHAIRTPDNRWEGPPAINEKYRLSWQNAIFLVQAERVDDRPNKGVHTLIFTSVPCCMY